MRPRRLSLRWRLRALASGGGIAIRDNSGSLPERSALIAAPYGSAHQIVSDWVQREHQSRVAARRKEPVNQQGPALSAPDPHSSLKALAIPIREHALVGRSLGEISRTPLEDRRRAAGLHVMREKAYQTLAELCTLEAGLACLDSWTSPYVDRYCHGVNDARELFPNLTLTEICFLPLIRRLPDTYLECATGFDARAALIRENPHAKVEMTTPCIAETPMQLEMRVDGITFVTDRSDLVALGGGSGETNPENCEIVAYKSEVAAALANLVPLVIEAPRLVEILREQTAEALPVGVGRIRQAALNQVSDLEHRSGLDAAKPEGDGPRSIADDVRGLSGEAASAFGLAERTITDRLVRARLRHDSGEAISAHELVGLIGLLRDVPACLLQEEPFRGTILFASANLVFAHEKGGQIAEVCSLDAASRQIMREALFSEVITSSDSNRTMLTIQGELTARIQSALFGDLANAGESLSDLSKRASPIEEIGIRVYSAFGVGVMGLAERIAKGDARSVGLGVSGPLDSAVRLKLSRAEMEQIESVFERCGKPLLANVKSVEKVQRTVMTGDAADTLRSCAVDLDAETGRIIISELSEIPFSATPPAGRDERALLLAHAVGISLWSEVAERRFWHSIRFAAEGTSVTTSQEKIELNPENFLHPNGMKSPKDDFASSFAACLLARSDFESKASVNPVIAAKLAQIDAFLEQRGVSPEKIGHPLISLDNASKGLRAIFKQMPDPNDLPALRRFLVEMKENKEQAFVDPEGNEHDGSPLITAAEAKLKRAQEAEVRDLLSALSDLFSEAPDEQLGEIAEKIHDAASSGDLDNVLQEVAADYPSLGDNLESDEDLVETLRSMLSEIGLIEDEADDF